MNVKGLSVVSGFLAMWAGGCMASGVIQFQGRIVSPSCAAGASGGSTLELKGCPQAYRGNQFDVQTVRSVQAVGKSPVNIKLVSDSGEGRFYDQRYMLVDAGGKPVQSGAYIVTMTAP
ncbi:type 1 fimbrial protein [Pseudomonas sp. P115]|uniref:type 1 fimbrial protein n=1 Tax=Pseudomonas pisciculturae TaxID=2730413 RepID=UPI001891FF6F|nr:type 1 fimbrial protein [Pseudomonas pisciculturae]MBF6029204.1 type 1 fimbrial protein [Pseudomonas pisciculturae]